MYKQQARYLVKRRRPDLWAQVLVPDNVHRRQLIDQVTRKLLFATTVLTSVDVDYRDCHA